MQLAMRNETVRLIDAPAADVPRQRLLKEGPQALPDADLVALVLRGGARGGADAGSTSAVALATQLLREFDGVQGLLAQNAATLRRVRGLGDAKAAALLAIRELLARAEFAALKEASVLRGSKDARRYLSLLCGSLEREVFGLLLLDTRLHLLGIENVTTGSIDRTTVYSREIVKCCLRYNAAAAILFHNHPSGIPEPSELDKLLTSKLKAVLKELDIRLLDHIVIGGMRQVSMAERKLI